MLLNCTGTLMDVVFTLIGGSCIKLVYSLGEKVKTEDSVVIRMTTFAADQLEESMLFLKERFGGDVGRGQTVFTTGVGCHVNSEFINSALNIRSVEKRWIQDVCSDHRSHF